MQRSRVTAALGCALLGASCGASTPSPRPEPSRAAPNAQTSSSVTAVASAVAPPTAPENVFVRDYGEAARRIREASLAGDGAFRKLSFLSDHIGARLSGSPELERAVTWAKDTFSADGHERVSVEPVRVPHWVRGAASAELLTPTRRALEVLALGGSVATPPAGITAELAVVSSFAELEARKDSLKGKIVVFDHPMASTGNPGLNYGDALPYRVTGASRAAAFGAVAVLVRSLTAHSLGAPHTGSMRYLDPHERQIPAASISVETAEWLHRLASAGEKLSVKLALTPKTLPDADSANVTAELRGRERPEEVVLIGAHLDSWDVGQGAQDDGAGVVTVMQALTTLRTLGLVPRRTLRAVLFTNEENGVRGANQYAETHRAELERHVAAFEMDAGGGAPVGFMTDGEQPFLPEARAIAALLAPLGASMVVPGFAGEDVSALKPGGVPLFGFLLDIEHYFDVHHSVADTLDKVDPQNLQKAVAALATQAFVVADREGSFRASPSAGGTSR